MTNFKKIEFLSEHDMALVTGGSISFSTDPRFLNKDECKREAKLLLDNGSVKNMTQQEIAEEIYAHAVLFLSGITAEALSIILQNYLSSFIAGMVADYLIEHSATVDITDGGDTLPRRLAYAIIWNTL